MKDLPSIIMIKLVAADWPIATTLGLTQSDHNFLAIDLTPIQILKFIRTK